MTVRDALSHLIQVTDFQNWPVKHLMDPSCRHNCFSKNMNVNAGSRNWKHVLWFLWWLCPGVRDFTSIQDFGIQFWLEPENQFVSEWETRATFSLKSNSSCIKIAWPCYILPIFHDFVCTCCEGQSQHIMNHLTSFQHW